MAANGSTVARIEWSWLRPWDTKMEIVMIQVVCPRPRGPRLRPRSIIHEGFMEALGLVGP